MARLVSYPWPGNIRELENVLERAVILANQTELEIGSDLLPTLSPVSSSSADAKPGPGRTLEEVERDHVLAVLRQRKWVIEGPKGAARILGLHPNTLRSRLNRLGITRPPHEES
jgi:transcriptional regulator with GAF, ATPase, and Fis domain